LKAHGDDNKPLLPLLVCKGWTHALPLCLSLPPFFFVAHVVLFHNSTHTTQNIHTQRQKNKTKKAKGPQDPQIKKQNKKQKERIKQRGHKDLEQSYIEQKCFLKKKKRRRKTKPKKEEEIMNGKREGRERKEGKITR
jgi:hypothetical protein